MRGPGFYLCPSVRLFVNCRSKSKIMYKIQTGQLLVSCREWALKEISWLPDLLNEVWVLVSILLGNDMWIEYLYKQAFYFCQWLETRKKKNKEKRGLFILAYQDSFLWNKGRDKSFWILWWSPSWNFISSLLLPWSCWVATATWLLPHNPVRLTGYRFSSKWGQDQNPNLGHWSHKVGGLRPRTALRPSAGCTWSDGRFALVA